MDTRLLSVASLSAFVGQFADLWLLQGHLHFLNDGTHLHLQCLHLNHLVYGSSLLPFLDVFGAFQPFEINTFLTFSSSSSLSKKLSLNKTFVLLKDF